MSIRSEKYSFSKLSTFQQCKYQYYLSYIARLKGEGNAFSEYGSFCHEILEKYSNDQLGIYELADVYEENYIYKVEHEFPDSFVDLADLYYNDGKTFFENFEGLGDIKVLGVEKRFEHEIKPEDEDPFMFTGIIDLLYEDEEGRLVVHDWKSKSKFKTKAEQKKYARQLYLYSMYVKEQYGRYPDILRFYMFRKNTPINIEFNKDDFDEAIKWAKDSVHEIRHCNEFPAFYDEFFCKNLCDYRNDCEEGKEVSV